MALTKSLNN